MSDSDEFEGKLLRHLQLGKASFRDHVKTMRVHRDKFIAHLDFENEMPSLSLDIPKASVWFYHSQLVLSDPQSTSLGGGFYEDLDDYYMECEKEARRVYAGRS